MGSWAQISWWLRVYNPFFLLAVSGLYIALLCCGVALINTERRRDWLDQAAYAALATCVAVLLAGLL